MARSPRSLDELKSSLEESMAEALQHPQQDTDPGKAENLPAPVTNAQPKASSEAERLTETCNTTAAEIQATGDAVVQVANSIAAETRALAELLRKHGASIAARIEEFGAMSKRVSDKLNAARDDVIGTSGPAPSIAPQIERDGK